MNDSASMLHKAHISNANPEEVYWGTTLKYLALATFEFPIISVLEYIFVERPFPNDTFTENGFILFNNLINILFILTLLSSLASWYKTSSQVDQDSKFYRKKLTVLMVLITCILATILRSAYNFNLITLEQFKISSINDTITSSQTPNSTTCVGVNLDSDIQNLTALDFFIVFLNLISAALGARFFYFIFYSKVRDHSRWFKLFLISILGSVALAIAYIAWKILNQIIINIFVYIIITLIGLIILFIVHCIRS